MAKEKFKLLKLLGGRPGGFAQTWQAEVLDPVLKARWGRVVAIEIPLTREIERILINGLILNSFLRTHLKQVQDSHIVRYLDFERYENRYVMVMECVEGQSLRERIEDIGEGHPLALAEAINIAKQTCQGMSELHRHGLIMGDLKPGIIIITHPDNRVKIDILPIMLAFKSQPEYSSVSLSAMYYMSPEVLGNNNKSIYSDIYSLGVILYEMLTGAIPFQGEHPTEVLAAILDGNVTPPGKLNPMVDNGLNQLVLKSMAADWRHRYQTSTELLEVLGTYQAKLGHIQGVC